MSNHEAPEMLQAFRSLPQSITWRPVELCMSDAQAQSVVQELCAALDGTPLAQAVSELNLSDEYIEPPIAALRASFPNVLHFKLYAGPHSTASSLNEALAAWPMLRSISIGNDSPALAVQQHLEAAARTAADLKAGQPFEVVLRVCVAGEGDAARMGVLVAAIHTAGGGKVDVRWMRG